jgi:hypothetical protein
MNSVPNITTSTYVNDVQLAINSLRVNLTVLVWGPGETNKQKWFDKRTAVIKALNDASNGQDTIVTSEDLFGGKPPAPLDYGHVELIHAEKADIIIALVLASPSRQGGVYRELEIIAPHRRLREKVWIFLPDSRGYLNRFSAGMLRAYRDDHKISCSWNMIQTCKRIRDISISKVNEERKQRMYDKLNAFMITKGQELAL